ncbi:hypothetical protein CAPTEDRAFT_206342, partial [Capitella teleta]
LYWTDSVVNKVESINLDGSDRKTHLTATSPYGVAVFGDHMAWTNSEGLFWAFKEDSNAQSLETSVDNLRDLKVYWETGFPDFDAAPTKAPTESPTEALTEAPKTSETNDSPIVTRVGGSESTLAPTDRTPTISTTGTISST